MQIQTQISHLGTYEKYQKVLDAVENHLKSSGFLKVDLPVLLPTLIPESYLEVFETEYRYFDNRKKLYLAPSPELLLKRLLVDGIGDCYYLGKAFRNSEPASSRHLGEFTMLEMYKVGANYMDLADVVLGLLRAIYFYNPQSADAANMNSQTIEYQGIQVNLSRWEKLSITDAFARYASINSDTLFDHEKFIHQAQAKGYQVMKEEQNSDEKATMFPYEDLWSQIYTNEIEPHLGMYGYPTLIYDYPVEFAALAKPNTDGKTAQRFEFYIAGLELGNCYGELNDWRLQEIRLQSEQKERETSGKIQHIPDWGFINALKRGLPDCSGIAIGVERLAMIFSDVPSIADLQLVTITL